MPKRKYVSKEDYKDLCNKLRKIEKEVQKTSKTRQRILSTSSSSSSLSSSSSSSESDDSSTASRSNNEDRQPVSAASVNSPRAELCITGDAPASASPPPAPEAYAATSDAPQQHDDATPPAAPPQTDTDVVVDIVPELDAELLDILGVDPTKVETFGQPIQKDVAVRFEHTATNGLSKEDRTELTKKYLIAENCKLVGAPTLNPEVKAALSEAVIKRDGVIESKQKLMASAISSLGAAITLLWTSKDRDNELLRLLIDTGKLFCDCQHHETNVRRNFITFSVKKEMKEPLQNSKVDSFLFGNNLLESLKVAKAINKQGAELKPSDPKPSTSKSSLPSTSKNWKGQARPHPGRAPPARPKPTTPKTSASAATKDHRGSSSRRSQSHRASYNRR